MTDTSTNNAQAELVGRLRGFVGISRRCGTFTSDPHNSAQMAEQAAAEIERMAGEVERLSEALKLAEIALRLDGERMRAKYMSTLQNEASLDAVQRALGGGE